MDNYKYETELTAQGFKIIAGGDEAGRGPLAGPVSAAMVVLPKDYRIDGIDDSKKLSRKKRRELFAEIKKYAVTYGVGIINSDIIDRINILEATRLAFLDAYKQLMPSPDYILLDQIKLPWLEGMGIPHQAFVKGESISVSVAAASILAKETRDLIMEEMAEKYPEYGFEKHMGYGTKAHIEAIKKYGPCPIHRITFKPVSSFLSQPSLF